jgi:hypothetical protein
MKIFNSYGRTGREGNPVPSPPPSKVLSAGRCEYTLGHIFTLATPLQVAPLPEWIRLGTFTIPFPLCQIFNEIPSHRTMDRFSLHVGVVLVGVVLPWSDYEDVGRHLSVVLVSVVLPLGNVEDVLLVFSDGDGGNHCLQVNWSGVLHYIFSFWISCVASSGAISSVGSLVVVN